MHAGPTGLTRCNEFPDKSLVFPARTFPKASVSGWRPAEDWAPQHDVYYTFASPIVDGATKCTPMKAH